MEGEEEWRRKIYRGKTEVAKKEQNKEEHQKNSMHDKR